MIGAIVAGGLSAPTAPVFGAWESIETFTVGSLTPSLTFTAIPNTYKHLQIRYSAANDSGAFQSMRYNSDSGSNYKSHYLYGNGSATGAGSSTTATAIEFGDLPNSTTIQGAGIIDILDYASTTKNKTSRHLTGNDRNGAGVIVYTSGLWMNSSTAINSITVYATNNYQVGSKFALYGIKG